MKYVLKPEAKTFLRNVISDHYRFEEICFKAEAIFNAEQDECSFEIGRLYRRKDGRRDYFDSRAWLTLKRESMCDEVKESWELSDKEIDDLADDKEDPDSKETKPVVCIHVIKVGGTDSEDKE